MSNRELREMLIHADSEAEAIEVLDAAGYWDDESAWRYIGDSDTNWSTIGNQQGESVAALTEKLINSIDSYLMNACYERGIDPTGKDAPRSIREAVARFVENRDSLPSHAGRLENWLPGEVRTISNDLSVAATGNDSSKICINIADRGEGQTPDAIPETFMSLGKRNKVDIGFVQGKFNMGGTGALYFCGQNKMQLLVTRRNQALVEGTGRDGQWGSRSLAASPLADANR